MGRARLFAAAWLLCACGSTDEPSPHVLFASGERLVAEYYAVSQVQVFIGFYDSVRGERCAFTRGGPSSPGTNVPGMSYCLPTERAYRGSWFEDASCTAAFASLDSQGNPKVLVDYPADACAEQPTVYELGDPVDARTAYKLDLRGSCLPFVEGDEAPALRRVGPPLSLDAFVRAKEEVVPLSERMGALVLHGDDGSKLAVAGYDRVLEMATHPYGYGYEPRRDRWWPQQVAYSAESNRQYADASCLQPIASKDTNDALCPIKAIMEYVDGGCDGYDVQHFAAGPLLEVETKYGLDDQGVCGMATGGFGGKAVTFGALLPPESFERATTVDQGSGRVALRLDATSEGQGVLLNALIDREGPWPCQRAMATDGVFRCMPLAWGVAAFLDASCLIRVIGFTPPNEACGTPPLPVAVRVPADGSDSFELDQRGVALHVGAPAVVGERVYYLSDGICQEHYTGVAGYTWYGLRDEVLAEEMEPVGEVRATP
jgi:hypothetical protein